MEPKTPFYKSHTFAIWVTGVGAIVVILATWLWPADPNHPYGPKFLSFLGRFGRLLVTPVVGFFCATIGYIFGKRPPQASHNHEPHELPAPAPQVQTAQPVLTPAKAPITTQKFVPSVQNDDLVIPTDWQCDIRIKVDDSSVGLKLDNNQLNAIQDMDVIVHSAYSFDGRQDQFRTHAAATGARAFLQNVVVLPSESSQLVPLIHRLAGQSHLFLGNDTARVMKWPDNDKAIVQRWKLNVSVGARVHTRTIPPNGAVFKPTRFDLIIDWDTETNKLSVHQA